MMTTMMMRMMTGMTKTKYDDDINNDDHKHDVGNDEDITFETSKVNLHIFLSSC